MLYWVGKHSEMFLIDISGIGLDSIPSSQPSGNSDDYIYDKSNCRNDFLGIDNLSTYWD